MSQKPNLDDLQGIEVNEAVIKVSREILEKSATNHDFTKFEDSRTQQVDELIEKVALGEPLPTMATPTTTAVVEDDGSELERLKSLLEKGK